MPFIGDDHPLLRQVDDATWILQESLMYQGKIDRFVVEAPFETDLGSIPRPLVWLIPRYGRHTKSVILHDWLWRRTALHKADANGIFRRSMREEGVSLVHRWVMWAAVGLASTVSELGNIRRTDLPHILGLIAIGVPSAVFVAAPALIVSVWIALFYIVDGIGYALDYVANRLRRETARKAVNPPRLGWRLS